MQNKLERKVIDIFVISRRYTRLLENNSLKIFQEKGHLMHMHQNLNKDSYIYVWAKLLQLNTLPTDTMDLIIHNTKI